MTNIDKSGQAPPDIDPVWALADQSDARVAKMMELRRLGDSMLADTVIEPVLEQELTEPVLPTRQPYDQHALTVKNVRDTLSGERTRTAKRVVRKQLETGEISLA